MAACDDTCDLFSGEPNEILGEDIAVFHVHAELVREVLAGNHSNDTVGLFGCGGVDRQDLGVGMGALNNGCMQQTGTEVHIVDELRRTTDLVKTVDADGWFADALEFVVCGLSLKGKSRCHAGSPLLAAKTASMMGS